MKPLRFLKDAPVVVLLQASILLSSSLSPSHAAPSHPAKLAQEPAFGERSLININNISTWIRRDGWSARHPLRVNFSGTTFPRSTSQVVYQDGLVWGGRVRDGDPQVVRVGGQTFEIGTVPGRILARGVAEDPDDPSVRIYRVRRDYQSADLRLDAAELLDIGLSEVDDTDVDRVRAQYERDWRDWPWHKGALTHVATEVVRVACCRCRQGGGNSLGYESLARSG